MTASKQPSKPQGTASSGSLLPAQEIEQLLAAGDFDAIEEAWLTRLEEELETPPVDLGYFTDCARALDKAGAAETARFLLDLLDEQLREQKLWRDRLDLLRRLGHLLVEPEALHPTILTTLEKVHGHRPSYGQLAEKVGLHRAVEDHPKTWKKVERLVGLLEFDVGSIVRMSGKGAGEVVEVNMALESFKVRFETGLELRVGFGGANKLLEPLPESHVLYRKMNEPEVLRRLARDEPAELLRVVLKSYDSPRTGAQVKAIVAGIVPDDQWTRWWAVARKHPQVVTAPGGKQAYSWAASSADAQDAVWHTFANTDPRTQMELLRRDGERDPALRRQMAESLSATAAQAVDDGPGLAAEIWFNLERSGENVGDVAWAPAAQIAELDDPRALFAGIKDRQLRERSYEMARQIRPDWPQLFAQLLWQEPDPRSLDALTDALREVAPELVDSFLDQLLSQPRKSPAAFTWLAERAGEREEWLKRNPIRLLKQILWVLTSEDFASLRAARLVPLSDSGGTVPRLLSHLDEDQARQAYEAVEKAPGLESYQRQPLLNAILLRFPSLRQDEEDILYATREMIAAKKLELRQLKEEEIPANRRAIEEAREMGDLRENFEYKSARQRHEYLSARAGALSRDLTWVRPIDPSQVKGDEVIIGSRVHLAADDGATRAITILGPWESDPERDVLSNESETAQTLLGLKLGDPVDVAGVAYRVVSIEPWE